MITKYEFHPLADVLPVKPEVCKRMKPHMAVHGQQDAILLYQGKIMDGRHRYICCQELKLEPLVKEFRGTWEDAVAFCIGRLLGKNLNATERAMAASKLATMKQGGDRRSDQTAKLRFENPTIAQAAETFHVSERSIEAARAVQKHGTPELVAAVTAGEVAVSDAEKAAAHPPKAQRAALAAVASGEAKTLAAALAQPSANGAAPKPAAGKPASGHKPKGKPSAKQRGLEGLGVLIRALDELKLFKRYERWLQEIKNDLRHR